MVRCAGEGCAAEHGDEVECGDGTCRWIVVSQGGAAPWRWYCGEHVPGVWQKLERGESLGG